MDAASNKWETGARQQHPEVQGTVLRRRGGIPVETACSDFSLARSRAPAEPFDWNGRRCQTLLPKGTACPRGRPGARPRRYPHQCRGTGAVGGQEPGLPQAMRAGSGCRRHRGLSPSAGSVPQYRYKTSQQAGDPKVPRAHSAVSRGAPTRLHQIGRAHV